MRSLIRPLLVLPAMLLIGCFASFSERPPFPAYAGPSRAVPVVVSTSGESFLYLAPGEWINWPFSANLARAGEDAIWRSGWVVGTIDDGEVSDLRLSVARYQGPGVGLLSVLTAYFIPGVVDIRIDVAVKLSRSAHGTRECSRSHELRVWYQTLLIFVYPFRSPTSRLRKNVDPGHGSAAPRRFEAGIRAEHRFSLTRLRSWIAPWPSQIHAASSWR